VRIVAGDCGSETFILCRSADRAAKERAMRQRFEQRIESGLESIANSCAQRKCDLGVIERRVGRLLGINSRAARLFTVEVSRDASKRVVTNGQNKPRKWSRRFGSRRTNCGCVRYGIKRPNECRHTFWSASWRTCCVGRWKDGRNERVLAEACRRFWKNSRGSRAQTWFCPQKKDTL
jgi:hypothetical protein